MTRRSTTPAVPTIKCSRCGKRRYDFDVYDLASLFSLRDIWELSGLDPNDAPETLPVCWTCYRSFGSF